MPHTRTSGEAIIPHWPSPTPSSQHDGHIPSPPRHKDARIVPGKPKAQSLVTEGSNLRYPRNVPWDSLGTEGIKHLHYHLQWSATVSPRQRGVSPGGGGEGRGLPLRQIAFRKGEGRRVSLSLSTTTSLNPTLTSCFVCTNLHNVHVCHGSWAGFSLSSGVAVIGTQPCGRTEGQSYLVSGLGFGSPY